MRIQTDKKISIERPDSFDIGEILACGQCFRFEQKSEQSYDIIANGKFMNVEQTGDSITFYGAEEEDLNTVWRNYFDLNEDYGKIKVEICKDDPIMERAASFAPGIRILNQEPFECLISFIISQNNHIPRIKQIIKTISERYGEEIVDGHHAFPKPEQLIDISEEEIFACRTGFRAKYIRDAVVKIHSGEIDLNELRKLDTVTAREKLMNIKGVGPKVSDCVLLFAFGRKEVFPVDVWIKRVMQDYYFKGNETHISDIHALAQASYGAYAGIAQQYLFHYARSNK